MGQYRRKSCNQTTVSLIITSDHNRAKSEQVKIDEDWVGWSRIDQPRLSTYKSRQILRRPFFPLSHKVIGHYHSSVLLVISTGFVMCHAKPSIPHLFSVVPWVTVHWLVGPYETTPSPCFMVSHVKSTLNFKDMSIDKRALWAKWKCNKSVWMQCALMTIQTQISTPTASTSVFTSVFISLNGQFYADT